MTSSVSQKSKANVPLAFVGICLLAAFVALALNRHWPHPLRELALRGLEIGRAHV